jgi:PIN domain nuclease of toxin-antitoxin system
MKLLLDTHVLLWAAGLPEQLSAGTRLLLNNQRHELLFSVVSLWEISAKRKLGHPDLRVEPPILRRGLLDNGYKEVPITGLHILGLDAFASRPEDPFDGLLLAQAQSEGVTLLTNDTRLAEYGALVRLV